MIDILWTVLVKSLPFAEESGGLKSEEEEEQHDVDDDKHLLLLVVTTQIWNGVRVFQKYLLRNK
jgi:hypothetical protein